MSSNCISSYPNELTRRLQLFYHYYSVQKSVSEYNNYRWLRRARMTKQRERGGRERERAGKSASSRSEMAEQTFTIDGMKINTCACTHADSSRCGGAQQPLRAIFSYAHRAEPAGRGRIALCAPRSALQVGARERERERGPSLLMVVQLAHLVIRLRGRCTR